MGEISARNFGLLIAYLVPGFITVLAVGGIVPSFGAWLATSPDSQPTVGGVLFITLASLAAGMLVSSTRFIVIDTIHHRTGITPPHLDFSKLQPNLAAFGMLVEYHYRYYQFCANTLVAVAVVYGVRLAGGCSWCGGFGWADCGFLVVEAVLFATSRDTLRKYYSRASEVLRTEDSTERDDVMSNGCGPHNQTIRENVPKAPQIRETPPKQEQQASPPSAPAEKSKAEASARTTRP